MKNTNTLLSQLMKMSAVNALVYLKNLGMSEAGAENYAIRFSAYSLM